MAGKTRKKYVAYEYLQVLKNKCVSKEARKLLNAFCYYIKQKDFARKRVHQLKSYWYGDVRQQWKESYESFLREKTKEAREQQDAKSLRKLSIGMEELNNIFNIQVDPEDIGLLDPFNVSCTCGVKTLLIDSAELYNGKSYGFAYRCPKCGAYVGCHEKTSLPKGVPANRQTHYMRIQAHNAFDQIWKSRSMNRSEAYKWLSDQLGIPIEKTHIAMFDAKTCEKVVSLSKKLI